MSIIYTYMCVSLLWSKCEKCDASAVDAASRTCRMLRFFTYIFFDNPAGRIHFMLIHLNSDFYELSVLSFEGEKEQNPAPRYKFDGKSHES